MLTDIRKLAESSKAILNERRGVYIFTILIAERKAFFSRKALSYIARFRIDDTAKELCFTEMLKEAGAGLSMGDIDGLSAGLGLKKWSYRIGLDGRSGSIEEESDLFGKLYKYKFNISSMRDAFKIIADSAGYRFKYQVTSLGL